MSLCYLDRQFCSAPCGNTECGRNLNDKVYADARRWWRDQPGEAPIAMADMSKGCDGFVPVPEHVG
jgi:hypothetical protein